MKTRSHATLLFPTGTADWKSNWYTARPTEGDLGTRKKIASRRLGRLLTRYQACSLSRCQEIVEDSIRDTAFETATSGAVKLETLSGKNSA